MRVTINPTLDMEFLTWLPRPSYEYCGPLWAFKGDQTAQEEEMSQLAFTDKLMNIFQAQYGDQKGILDFLTGQAKQMVANPTGYQPQDLSAMRTQATDTIAQTSQNARQAVANEVSAASGGSKLAGVAGSTLAGEAAVDIAQQAEEANAQNQISMANAQLRQQNYWRGIDVLSGTSAQMNPLGYSGQGLEGGNVVGNLSGAVTAANGPTLGQTLGGIATGALGAAGNILSGSFAKGGAFAG